MYFLFEENGWKETLTEWLNGEPSPDEDFWAVDETMREKAQTIIDELKPNFFVHPIKVMKSKVTKPPG